MRNTVSPLNHHFVHCSTKRGVGAVSGPCEFKGARWAGDGWLCYLWDALSGWFQWSESVFSSGRILCFWQWDHFCPSYVWVLRADSSDVRPADGGDLSLFLLFVFGAKGRLLSESLLVVTSAGGGRWMLSVVLDLRQNKRENGIILCLWRCLLIWLVLRPHHSNFVAGSGQNTWVIQACSIDFGVFLFMKNCGILHYSFCIQFVLFYFIF